MEKLIDRRFLNPKTGTAAAQLVVNDWGSGEFNVQLSISDCSKTIVLHHECKNAKTKREALSKYKNLLEIVQKTIKTIEDTK